MAIRNNEPVFSVILAAGSSKRLGQPKALLNIGNTSLIDFTVNRLKEHNLTIIIVTREELFLDIKCSVTGAETITNRMPEEGRTGSLQVGLKFILANYSKNFKTLVVPVDRPGFSSSTLSKILSMTQTSCPEKDGKGGHPLLLSELDVKRILSQNPKTPLREIIEPNRFEVMDKYLHLNVDTQEDISTLTKFISSFESNVYR